MPRLAQQADRWFALVCRESISPSTRPIAPRRIVTAAPAPAGRLSHSRTVIGRPGSSPWRARGADRVFIVTLWATTSSRLGALPEAWRRLVPGCTRGGPPAPPAGHGSSSHLAHSRHLL